eukprot:Nk52_evm1s1232 gene=Nk52_evmTU1s1232
MEGEFFSGSEFESSASEGNWTEDEFEAYEKAHPDCEGYAIFEKSEFDFQQPDENSVRFTVGSIDRDVYEVFVKEFVPTAMGSMCKAFHHLDKTLEEIEDVIERKLIKKSDFVLMEDYFGTLEDQVRERRFDTKSKEEELYPESKVKDLRNKLIRDCMRMALSGGFTEHIFDVVQEFDDRDAMESEPIWKSDIEGYIRVLACLQSN